MIRVFVSSVSRGMEETRAQLVNQLRTAQFHVVNMETFGARDERPLDVCLREIGSADAAVVIVGPRYGAFTPGQEISYTHAEYREAKRLGIPVLAFVLDQFDESDTLKQRHLRAFVDEAGQSLTYKVVAANQLSAEVLASLSATAHRGQLGPRYSLFQPWERFFGQQLKRDHAFNHLSHFVGRETELAKLQEFVRSQCPVFVLMAPGGRGKSRLLMEIARIVDEAPTMPRLLFVDAGSDWNAEQINALPDVATVLVVDDAHRRPDLDKLIAACRQRNDSIRFLVSCRPSAVEVVWPQLADLTSLREEIPTMKLCPLSAEASAQLAESTLGAEFTHLARRLVRVADKNPLVIAVGGACIAAHQVGPNVLDHTPEQFRTIVLDRLLHDPALAGTNTEQRRGTLELLSAIGPINALDGELRQQCAAFLRMSSSELARQIGALEEAGFIQRRGRLIRVTPDVLGDHLLYRAAVNRSREPTGFVDNVVSHFGSSVLGNILANAAELDWRGTETGQHDPVLTHTWRVLQTRLPDSTNRQRVELLAQLRRAALFVPDSVIEFAEWICDHPHAPPDNQMRTWGLEDSPQSAIDYACDLLAFIAGHPRFTKRCLARLWHFAEIDERPTNPNPGHPRRRIADLLKYDSHQHPDVQLLALDYAAGKLRTSTIRLTWAIEALGSVLARHGEGASANRRVFTLSTFALAPHLTEFRSRRQKAIDCLTELAQGHRVDNAAAALHQLALLLCKPYGLLGRRVDEEEVLAWLPEAQDVAERLARLAVESRAAITRYLARRKLREASREHWPALGSYLDDLLADTPGVAEESFYDVLLGAPRVEFLDDWRAEQDRRKERLKAAADVLWTEYPEPGELVAVLLAALRELGQVVRPGASREWDVLTALAEARLSAAEKLIDALAAGEHDDSYSLIPPVLIALARAGQRVTVGKLLKRFATSPHELLRANAAGALRSMIVRAESEDDLPLVELFLSDSSTLVRRAATRALAAFAGPASQAAIQRLVEIDWEHDVPLAECACDVLNAKYGLDPALLTDEQVDVLLGRCEQLPSIDAHDILEFISFGSTRRPRPTITMLVRRIQDCAHYRRNASDDKWLPIPYNGHGLSLPGVMESNESAELLKLVRDAMLQEDPLVWLWLPELLSVAAGQPLVTIHVLQDWARSGDAAKIVGAARLLKGFEHTVVFSLSDFVAELLEAAGRLDGECLDGVRGALYGVAISGVHWGGNPGEPAPRDVSDKEAAERLVTRYADRPVVADFYKQLVRHAERSIREDMIEFDEENEA